NLQAIVFILNAEPMPHRLKTVGKGERVFLLRRQIDNRRTENRPVTPNEDAPSESQLLFVPQVLDRRIDIPVEPKITDLRVSLLGADREVDFVPANCERILIQTVPFGDVDQPTETDPGSSHNI